MGADGALLDPGLMGETPLTGITEAVAIREICQCDEDEFRARLRDTLLVSPRDGRDAHAAPSDIFKLLLRVW